MVGEKIIAIGAVVCALTGLYYYFHRKAKVEVLYILPKNTLLYYYERIGKRYSKSYKKAQAVWRKERRAKRLGSEEYYRFVRKCHGALDGIMEKAVKEVLEEEKCSWRVFDDSVRLYKHDSAITEAARESKIVTCKGAISPELSVEIVREILEYYISQLNIVQPYTPSPLQLYPIEDEIYERFGFEFEEVERAFELHLDCLSEYELLINMVREARLNEDVQEFTNF